MASLKTRSLVVARAASLGAWTLAGRLTRILVGRRRGGWARAGRLTPPMIATAYLLLLAYPGILFAHHTSRGSFHVSSDAPIDPRIAEVLDDAAARLARSPLADPGMEHRLYICNTALRGWLLFPRGRGAFGTTYSLLGNTILNRVDIPANLVYRVAPRHERRPLGAVIAHERMHALMARRYGTIACWRMPAWKTEGYCEFVGGDPSFGVEEGKWLIREGRGEDSGPIRYFRYYAMVKYLLEVEGLTIDEVVSREFEEDQLLVKVRGSIDHLRF
jgi:hypothetical protein